MNLCLPGHSSPIACPLKAPPKSAHKPRLYCSGPEGHHGCPALSSTGNCLNCLLHLPVTLQKMWAGRDLFDTNVDKQRNSDVNEGLLPDSTMSGVWKHEACGLGVVYL